MALQTTRIEWIDVLKGVLLTFITFSHFGAFPPGIRELVSPTGSVWIPCFFFVSGMLFSNKKYPKFGMYLFAKFKTLLLPYLSLSLVLLFLDWNIYLKTNAYFFDGIFGMITGNGAPKAGPLWFFHTLFFVNIAYYLIVKYCKSVYFRIGIAFISSLMGFVLFKYSISLPLRFDVVLSALPFLAMGHILKEFIKTTCNFFNSNTLYAIPVIIFVFWGSRFFAGLNPGAILGKNTIGHLLYFNLSAFGGILSIIWFISLLYHKLNSQMFAKRLSDVFQYISRNALPLLAFQSYVLIIIDHITKVYWHTDVVWLDFFLKLTILSFTMYLLIIPFFNNKLYFIGGKNKVSWKQSKRYIS